MASQVRGRLGMLRNMQSGLITMIITAVKTTWIFFPEMFTLFFWHIPV